MKDKLRAYISKGDTSIIDEIVDVVAQASLHTVAGLGHAGIVELLLANGADVNLIDDKGYTALHLASQRGHVDVVELLLRNGANMYDGYNNGPKGVVRNPANAWMHGQTVNSALSLAVKGGHVAVVELLLRNGARVNLADSNGQAILRLAAQEVGVLEALLKNGVAINDVHGQEILCLAAQGGHTDVVEFMLAWGVRANAVNRAHQTALQLAEAGGHGAITMLLRKCGAEEVVVDREAHILGRKGRLATRQAVAGGNVHVNDARVALHHAAAGGHYETVARLLERGANVNAIASNGETAAMLALGQGHNDVANLLLSRKDADVNIAEADGGTLLHYAATGGYYETAVKLLEIGANINAIVTGGITPLMIALRLGHNDVANLLLSRKDVDINLASANGTTALHLVTARGDDHFVELLLANGAKVKADATGSTALHVAALAGHTSIVEALLDRGIRMTMADADGNTVLHLAARGGHGHLVRKLLVRGVDEAQINNKGDTALNVAAEEGHFAIVELIRTHLATAKAHDVVTEMAGAHVEVAKAVDGVVKPAGLDVEDLSVDQNYISDSQRKIGQVDDEEHNAL